MGYSAEHCLLLGAVCCSVVSEALAFGADIGVYDVPKILEKHATVENRAQELTDLAYISNLQAEGVLQVLKTQPQQLHIMVGSNRGKVIQVGEWQPEFAEGQEDGSLVDPVTWQYLTKKQTGTMAFLSALADKYYTISAVLQKRQGGGAE